MQPRSQTRTAHIKWTASLGGVLVIRRRSSVKQGVDPSGLGFCFQPCAKEPKWQPLAAIEPAIDRPAPGSRSIAMAVEKQSHARFNRHSGKSFRDDSVRRIPFLRTHSKKIFISAARQSVQRSQRQSSRPREKPPQLTTPVRGESRPIRNLLAGTLAPAPSLTDLESAYPM